MHQEGEVCSVISQTSTLDAVRGVMVGGDGHHPPHRYDGYEAPVGS